MAQADSGWLLEQQDWHWDILEKVKQDKLKPQTSPSFLTKCELWATSKLAAVTHLSLQMTHCK